MGILNLFRRRKENNRAYSRVELISEQCNTFFSWQAQRTILILSERASDKVKAVGKAIIKQMRRLMRMEKLLQNLTISL